MKILVVDDDLELLRLIAFALRQAGYMVLEAQDGPQALAVFERERPDLVVLDVNLPRLNGFEVLKKIRAASEGLPVMMLTVRTGEEDQVRGLDLGADDYLGKPFSPRTLLARVRALLRRAGVDKPAPLTSGDFVLDLETQAVRVKGGSPVRLTNLEVRLLQLLLANGGHTLPLERLTSHVWGYRGLGDRQLLKQLVHRLRRKLEVDPASPRYLVTVSGVGYALHPGGAGD
ncbi:MAG TPA: response regulator transcription factor [Candidatus Polarisedimenticolia bacterium]|jgi:DNA-binding response OmpR family regulator|nr:response regulator transcription factor [Candidatus Polarisedimenticolia bacterium]